MQAAAASPQAGEAKHAAASKQATPVSQMAPELDSEIPAGLPLYLQRKCDSCAAAEDDEQTLNRKAENPAPISAPPTPPADPPKADKHEAEEIQTGLPLYLQRKCSACDGDDEHLHRKENGATSTGSAPDSVLRSAIAASGTGQVLPASVKQEMEGRFGVDLGAVRIHTGASAQHANRIANAEAFTLGERIYFGAGRFAPASPAGRRLLAHELTHVVQNQRGTCPPAAAVRHHKINISRPDDPAEQEAERSAQAIDSGAPITVNGTGSGALHRAGKSTWDSVTDWGAARVNDASEALDSAGGAIADGAGAVAAAAGEEAMKILRATVPELAAIIDEGPINYFKRQVKEALDAHMPSALGGFSINELIDGVSSWVGEGAGFIKGLLKGDAKSCEAFAKMMEGLTKFVTGLIDNPVVGFFKTVFGKVSDFIGKVSKVVLAPIFDSLSTLVSGAWTALKTVAKTVSGWFNSAKEALGAAWDAIMKKLGFDGEGEDGIWSKIKGFANDVWKSIKDTLAPVIGPLETIGSVLFLLTPMGEIHAIVKYGPRLVKLVTWIWDNGLDPEKIRTAPAEIKGMLESLSGGIDGFKGVLQTGFDWLTTQLGALGGAFLKMVGAITGLPLLGFAESLFKDAQKAAQDIVASVKSGAAAAIAAIEGAATKVIDFISPYKEVLSSLILAIASPPMIPVILGGWAWRALPRCVKIPILNFILDIAITAIDAVPELPTFGVLWPLLKPGVMAFLGTLRASSDDIKELVSNKVAKIISGASPDFLIGFVKGFATGVWEGITDPFKAIWTVLEGLDTATQYLLSLAGAGDKTEAKEETRAPAASAAAPVPAMPSALPAAAPAPAPAKVAITGEIHKMTPASVPAAKQAEQFAAKPAVSSVPAKPTSSPGIAKASAPSPVSAASAEKSKAPAAASASPKPATTSHKTITETIVPKSATPPVPTPIPATAPTASENAQPATEAEQPYVADPAAALNSGAPMPDATRRLLEKLAAQKAAHPPTPAPAPEAESASPVSVSTEDMPALKERASVMAGELSPDVETVKGGFWDAVQEYFSGDKMTFDDLVNKLSEAWESAKAKISEGGAWLANQMIGFFQGGGAEGELGDKIGWLTGTIAFQALLDAITAGTWAGAGPVLKGIAKFINWPMEAMGEAFKLLKTLGKYLLDGLKSLGGVIKDAAAGAFKTVSKALGHIGERLLAFGEEILGKFGGKAAKAESKVVGTLGKEGVELTEREAAQLARQKAAQEALAEQEKAAQKLEQEAGKETKVVDEPHPAAEPEPQPEATPESKAEPSTEPKAAEPAPAEEPKAPAESAEAKKPADTPATEEAREASVAESGHVDNDKLTPSQTKNEVEQFTEHPQSLEGTAPNRRSKVGEHEWRETQVNGECTFCRYSPTKVCVNTPELRTGHLQNAEERTLETEEAARKQADAAIEARAKAATHQPLSAKDEQVLTDELTEAEKRTKAAKDRLKAERGNATKAANAGDVEKENAARKKIEALESELKAAEGDAGAAKELMNEQKEALRKADEAEALAQATKEEAEAAAARLRDQKKMASKLDTVEAELLSLQSKATRTPEQIQRIFALESEAKNLKKELAASIEIGKGMTPEVRKTLRAGTPFKAAGGAEREREFLAKLPAEAKGPKGTYIDYVTGEPLPLSELSPDHVVPVDEIFNMKGFDRLSPADRQAILDLPENLRLLERNLNSSKQAKGMAQWLADKGSDLKLTPAQRQALVDIETEARAELEKEIARRLAKAKVP